MIMHRNRLQSVTSDAGAFAFTYDSLGRRTTLTHPNGTEADHAYDTVGRLTSLVNKITGGAGDKRVSP